MAKGNSSFIQLIILIGIGLVLNSCVPKFEGEQTPDCANNQQFNPQTRGCDIILTPIPTLITFTIVEDSGATSISLTYTHHTSTGSANSCNVTKLGAGIDDTAATCTCFAGVCSATITPDSNFNGNTEFHYTLTNSYGASAEQIVVLTVTEVDDSPHTAGAQEIPVTEDTAKAFNISEGTGSEGAVLSYNRLTGPSNGILSDCMTALPGSGGGGDLSCTYAPVANFYGTDSFTYKIVDDSGFSSSAQTITLNVAGVNDLPTIDPIVNQSDDEDTDISVGITIDEGGGSYEDSQNLKMTVVLVNNDDSVFTSDSVEITYNGSTYADFDTEHTIDGSSDAGATDATITFKPVSNAVGVATVNVTIDDQNTGTAETGNFTVTFSGVNDPPTITGVSDYGVVEGSTASLDSIVVDEGGASDEDAQNVYITVVSSNALLVPNSNSMIKLYKDSVEVTGIDVAAPGYTLAGCDGGADCTGAAAPSGAVTPDAVGVIYYDSAGSACYISTGTGNTNWSSMTCGVRFNVDTDGATSLDASTLDLQLTASSGEISSSTITFHVQDSALGVDSIDFELTVNTTSAVHGGWKNIKAVGDKKDSGGTTITAGSITLDWNAFTVSGGNQAGWKIYRREYDTAHDYNSPLTTITSASTTEYTDNTITKNSVYYYEVRPYDTEGFVLPTFEVFNEIRIVAPPDNMAFAHRWIINQEVCGSMGLTTDAVNNFRCQYQGPGETLDGGTYYYDIGKDLLVDLAEAGCPYSSYATEPNCQSYGCIGASDPTTADITPTATDNIWYDRLEGKCYRSTGTADENDWEEFKNIAGFTSTYADSSQNSFLPPLVNVTQEKAYNFCAARTALANADITGIGTDLAFELPTRKEQIAYSAHDPDLSDTTITSTELGEDLEQNSYCNSSSAGEVSEGYSETDNPGYYYKYSIPGTFSSGIRSIYTGSIETDDYKLTQGCVSRYGIQDVYGNVSEWVTDQIICGINNQCVGLTATNEGDFVNRLDSTNNDMEVNDSFFDRYAMDLIVGPCNDSDSDDDCDINDSPLTGWQFDTEDNSSSLFSFPLGLPVYSNFLTEKPSSKVNLLEIGPSDGISVSALHEDYISINAAPIIKETDRRGGMATGGSYFWGDHSGRYALSFLPYTDVSSTDACLGISGTSWDMGDLTFTLNVDRCVTVEFVAGGTAGFEVATVRGYDISVQIENGVSTSDDIATAIDANPVAYSMITTTVDASAAQTVLAKDYVSPIIFVADKAGTAGSEGNNITVEITDTGAGTDVETSVSGYNIIIARQDAGDTTASEIAAAIATSLQVSATVRTGAEAINIPEMAASANLYGGIDATYSYDKEVGFRCIVEVEDSDYDTDANHSYSY